MFRFVLSALCASSAWMSAVGFYCQFVHYPTFRYVPLEKFEEFHIFHRSVTGLLVGPAILVQVIASFALLMFADRLQWWVIALSFLFLAASVGWTGFVSAPLHGMIATQGPKPELIDQLINTCWVRDVAWFLHSVLAIWVLTTTAQN